MRLREGEEQPHQEEPAAAAKDGFVGFSTGKNKRVAVSEESLKKAEMRLREGDADAGLKEAEMPPSIGFQTGSKKVVAPSALSLKAAEVMLSDHEDNGPALIEAASPPFKKGLVAPAKCDKSGDDNDWASQQSALARFVEPQDGDARTSLSRKSERGSGQDDEFFERKFDLGSSKKLLRFTEDDDVAAPVRPNVALQAALTPVSRPGAKTGSSSKSFSTPRTKPFQAPSRNVNTPATPMGKRSLALSTPVSAPNSATKTPPRNGPVSLTAPSVLPVAPRKSLMQLAGGEELKSYSDDDFKKFGVKGSTLNMTFEDAKGFRFDHGATGPEWFRAELLKDSSVKEELLSVAWVENHYSLIVWKLACMERAFPDVLGAVYLKKVQVLKQLQNRYVVETGGIHRPIFRKISERDDVATRYMVVVVTRVIDLGEDCPAQLLAQAKPAEGEEMDEKTAGLILASFATIEVSDGWYVMRAKLDAKLTEHLAMGRIFAGMKLRICGARLQGVTEPCPVLELPESAFLALSVNGCRRAKWHSRLGLRLSPPYPVGIKSVQPGGGTIPRLDLVIVRVMPLLYMQKNEETGRWSSHDAKAEADSQERLQASVAAECAACAEEMRADFDREDAQRRQSSRRLSAHQLQFERNEEVLYSAYLANPSVLDAMSEAQQALVMQLERRIEEERSTTIQSEVQSLTEKAQASRQVTPFVEIEVADCPMMESPDMTKIGRATVQVYSPDGELLENVLREGKLVSVFGLEAPRTRVDDFGRIRLKSGKMTMWKERAEEQPPAWLDNVYTPRRCIQLTELSKAAPNALFDWMGCVLQIAPFASGEDQVMYFFSDGSGNGLALAVECPVSFRVNYETRGELSQVQMKNLAYNMFDEHLRLHVAVASSRTELLKVGPADSAKLTDAALLIGEVNERMRHFVGFSGQVCLSDSFYTTKLVAVPQPFAVLAFSPATSGAVCVASWSDILLPSAIDDTKCTSCQRSLSDSPYQPTLDGIAICLDDGRDSYLCKLPTRWLMTMLSTQSAGCVELLGWLQVLLRTGKCLGNVEEQDEFFCRERLRALQKTKAGELALPSTTIVLLLNCAIGTDGEEEGICKHQAAAAALVTPEPIRMRPLEREWLLSLLWSALCSKRWAFSVARATGAKKHVPGWKDVYGEVESVAPLVERRTMSQMMLKAWDAEFK